MDNHLHIICLNVPYPVNYGGLFDLYYKLLAMQKQGVKIHLHCFEYGKGEQPELNKYCASVHYYKRKTGLRGLSFRYPYIVSSRKNKALLNRLCQDDYPILMEGVHCTFLLNDKRFLNRKCFVRLHNVEHIYYRNLTCFTASIFKKMYYMWESNLLKKYENTIASKATFISVTEKDAEAYKQLGAYNTSYLPLFLPQWKVSGSEGIGTYCLYQGDLSVAENEKAAKWLAHKVFAGLKATLIIAGKNPSQKTKRLPLLRKNISVIANPAHAQMQQLIAEAHINIIPSLNATGIKLKLLNALYNGRFCLVNNVTVEGTGLDKLCVVADGADAFQSAISSLIKTSFTAAETESRNRLLCGMFNNEINAQQLINLIFNL